MWKCRDPKGRDIYIIYKKLHSFDLNSIIHGSLHFTSFATIVCIFERYHIVSMKLSEIKHGISIWLFSEFFGYFLIMIPITLKNHNKVVSSVSNSGAVSAKLALLKGRMARKKNFGA